MLNICEMIGAAFVFVFFLMILAWCIYFVRRNAGIVDLSFCLSFMFVGWIYFFLGEGDFFKKLLMAILVTLWGGRLLSHLYVRYAHNPEDSRYVVLRKNWGGDPSGALFLMLFLFQGSFVILLSLPFLIVGHASESSWHAFEIIGVLVWAVGVVGEQIADSQLKQFKADPANSKGVCNVGLWYFSRHPNYFFEWIVWIGFALIALPTSGGWLAFLSPIVMLILLFKVSGIPLTEAHLLEQHGEAYYNYQKKTSTFFPWFPE